MAEGLLALLGKVKKPGASKSDMSDDDESGGMGDEAEEKPEGNAGEMAAADFDAAQQKGDHAAMYEAFERMFDACEADKKKPGGEY